MTEVRYAILIGINDYEVLPLDYCVKDADLIKENFTKYCNVLEENIFPIQSLYNKPIEDIYSSFEKIYQRIEATFRQGDDSIFFFFSGHGTKAGNSTALVFKNKIIQLQDIFQKLSLLKPRFLFALIDSCYSGVGIDDGIAKSIDEYHFAQQVAIASGYNIFCASAHDRPAKEDVVFQNGRFTHLFCEIVQNIANYKDGRLTLSSIYQLLDDSFKNKPEFRQLPFSQNKGLSTYPLAFINSESKTLYYSNHYINDIENYSWAKISKEIELYCSTTNVLINEIVRLIREILRNSKKWGDSKLLKIEISNNAITIIDDSKEVFDIFNPPLDAQKKARGGIMTARAFKKHFSHLFEYTAEKIGNFVVQSFTLKTNSEINPCELTLKTIFEFKDIVEGNIAFDQGCEKLIINMEQGGLDYSVFGNFYNSLILHSTSINKPIILRISDNDIMKEAFIEELIAISKTQPTNLIIE